MKKSHTILGVALLASSMSASAVTLVAGWDTFTGSSGWVPNQVDPNTAVNVVATTEHNNWSQWNNNDQGASGDGTFGNLSSTVASASTAFDSASGNNKNLSLNRSNGSIVFTLINNSGVDRTMEGFYFDAITRFNDAADTWALTVGGAISGTGGGGSIANVGNMNNATSAQRDNAVDLTGLSDGIWEAGTTATFTLAFTGATNLSSGGGQELAVDNIGITMVTVIPEPSSSILLSLAGAGLFFIRRRNC